MGRSESQIAAESKYRRTHRLEYNARQRRYSKKRHLAGRLMKTYQRLQAQDRLAEMDHVTFNWYKATSVDAPWNACPPMTADTCQACGWVKPALFEGE